MSVGAAKTSAAGMKKGPKKALRGNAALLESFERARLEDPVQAVVDFFANHLTHMKGPDAGQPIILEEWQVEEWIRPVYEPRDEMGRRVVRTGYWEIPRKNGKSTVAAGLALYHLVADGEIGAEVYCLAGETSQARIIFNLCKHFVETSALADIVTTFRDSLIFPERNGVLAVLSSKPGSKHGYNPSFVVVDEVHVQPDRELWDVMETGTGARSEPLMLGITTAGLYDPEGLAWQLHTYTESVRDGVIEDPTFYGCIYGIDPEDDWKDPANWAKANPNLDVTVPMSFLEQQFARVEGMPSQQNNFQRLYLNRWTAQGIRWIDLDVWNRCGAPVTGEAGKAYAGVDLASTTDMTALVVVVKCSDGLYDVYPRFYMPEARMAEREARDKVPYGQWAREGYIQATPGNVTDYAFVRHDILEMADQFNLGEVAIDRWNSTQLSVQLAEEDGLEVVGFGQGYASMSSPTKDLERMVLESQLRHGGNPVLTWNMNNTELRQDPAGNVKPDKSRSTGRIDGVVALIMALGRAMANDYNQESVYERRGLIRL